MARIRRSHASPSRGTPETSTTSSVVAFTPSSDDAAVMSDDGTDGGAPVPSSGSTVPVPASGPQRPSVASNDSFDGSVTWRSASLSSASAPPDPDVPLPSIEPVPLAGMLESQESFEGFFTWRSRSSTTPSISVSPPIPTAASSSSGGQDGRVLTPRSGSGSHGQRSRASGGSTGVNGAMGDLRLNSATSNGNTSTSTPGPSTPKTTTTGEVAVPSNEPSTPGVATPTATETRSPASSPNNNRHATPEAFNLAAVQAALNEDISRSPTATTSRASEERRHLSPTPTPRDTSNRRRRSSSGLRQPRHEVSDEEPPQNRFHQPGFQSAYREAKQLMVDLAQVLASNQLHSEPDTTMRRLYDEARELSAFTCPDTRTVGFVGDSGVGKSSLINSLLDIKGLARASASGRACTCVVTEFCYRPEPGFEIEVEYFATEELENQISELLESYRHFHLADLEDHEVRDVGDRANIAEHTFRSMFPGYLEDLETELLGEEEEEEVLQKLMSWLDESPRPVTVRESIADVELCSQRLAELTSESEDVDETALWPFIRKIRVYCNAVILSKGLILVDLPGLRDINAARRNITERYILECDEIFAVCNIIRATTDEGVQAVINLADMASLSNVGIICTRSDDIRVEEETRRDRRNELALSLEALRSRLTAAQHDLRTIEEDLSEFDEIDEDDFLDGERDIYIRLRRRATNARRLVEDREFDLRSFLIRTRNDNICQQLRDTYAERIPGGNLAVFCVSNTVYWDHRDLPRDVSRRHLELSGMIAVRKHCISIVAQSQLRAARLYMEQRIAALIESLQLWVLSGSGSLSAERKKAIHDTLEDAERVLRGGLANPYSELNVTTIRDLFQSFLAHYRNKDAWVAGAKAAADDWASRCAPGTYSAFCRHFGDYSTQAGGTHNWNEEAIESMVATLAPKWRDMCAQVESRSRDAAGVLDTLCDVVVDVLGSSEALDDEQTDVLMNSVRTHQRLLEARMEELSNEVRRDLAHLRTDALSGIHTSFIRQGLESSYRACNNEGGRGSDGRRKEIMRRRLRGDAIFIEMEMQVRARFNAITDWFTNRQMEATRAHFQLLKNNLDTLRDESVILEAESDLEFRMRVDEEVLRVRACLDGLLETL